MPKMKKFYKRTKIKIQVIRLGEKMMTFSDIFKKINGCLGENKIIDNSISLVPSIVGISNPVTGVILSGVKTMMDDADKYKFQCLLKGIATGLDQEKMMNQLYEYICDSERAFYVAGIFKRTMLNNSRIACCIMGIILSELVKENKDFSQDELIIFNMLDSAIDADLKNFDDIMKNYINDKHIIEFRMMEQGKREKYELTVDFFVKSRILRDMNRELYPGLLNEMSRKEEYGVTKEIKTTEISNKLMEYIEKVKIIIKYV